MNTFGAGLSSHKRGLKNNSGRSILAFTLMLTLGISTIAAINVAHLPSAYGQQSVQSQAAAVRIVAGASTKATDAYLPNVVTINVGGYVWWKNDDSVPHSATSGIGPEDQDSGASFDTGIMDAGVLAGISTANLSPGHYPYYCIVHPAMVGTLIVENGFSTDPDSILSLTTSKPSYKKGETVSVNGQVSSASNSAGTAKYVTLTVTNPRGVVFKVDQFLPSSNGRFSYNLGLTGTNAISGQWTILSGYGTAKQSINFSVEEAEMTLPIRLDQVTITDASGRVITTINAGSQVMVGMPISNLQSSKQQQVTAIIQIERSDGTTDYISWQTSVLLAGQSTITGFGWSPETPGTYKVKVFAWQSLGNPVPLADPRISTITVVNSRT